MKPWVSLVEPETPRGGDPLVSREEAKTSRCQTRMDHCRRLHPLKQVPSRCLDPSSKRKIRGAPSTSLFVEFSMSHFQEGAFIMVYHFFLFCITLQLQS